MSTLEDIAGQVAELVGRHGEGEARVTRTNLGLTRFANSFVHQHHSDETTTVSVRVAVEGQVASGKTTKVSAADLDRLVEDTVAAARLQPVDPHWPGVAGPAEAPAAGPDRSTVEATPDDRVDSVARFIEAGPGMSAAGFVDTEHSEMALATTSGQAVSGATARSTLDGIHRIDGAAGNGHQTSRAFSDIDGGSAGSRAARLASDGRNPIDVEPGEYPVVLAPECVATIAVFLGVYGFGGESVVNGQSFVKLDERQFDASFQLDEAPDDPRMFSFGFDAEGTPIRSLSLVNEGVSTAIVHDRRTARRLDAESTGHALTESYFGPLPTHMVVAGGEHSIEDLIDGVDRGIYVSTFNYCRILDPRTQVVTGLTRNGTFLIEKGEIVSPLSNLRFTQSFVDALGDGRIEAIGSDQRFADSEFGPGLTITPSLRLASWNFTGGAKG